VFGAGVATSAAGEVVTSGGRVLSVVGRGADIDAAAAAAYGAASRIHFDGMALRRDIGRTAIASTPAARA
jgi:phosphoribosylamine--glycine ligase